MTRMDNDHQWEEFTRRAEARISRAVELLIMFKESIRHDFEPWRSNAQGHIDSALRALGGTASALAPGRMPEPGRIVEYRAITNFEIRSFNLDVTALLKRGDGWEIHDQLKISGGNFTQAMVRRESTPAVTPGVFPMIREVGERLCWDVYWGPGASDISFLSEADARTYIASKIRVEGK